MSGVEVRLHDPLVYGLRLYLAALDLVRDLPQGVDYLGPAPVGYRDVEVVPVVFLRGLLHLVDELLEALRQRADPPDGHHLDPVFVYVPRLHDLLQGPLEEPHQLLDLLLVPVEVLC